MAGPFQLWPSSPPPLKPGGAASPMDCDDIDALDAALAAMSPVNGVLYKTLALSDGHGPDSNGDLTWMLPKVIPLTPTGVKPYVTLSVEFRLISHSKGRAWIDLLIEGDCGTRGELRLGYPSSGRRGWQLHVVTHPCATPSPNPACGNAAPPPELADEPKKDDKDSSKRDDIFREMFS